MIRRLPRLPALGVVLALAVLPVPAQSIAPAPVPGPVGLSVGNESRTALTRAERWLRRADPGTTLPEDPVAAAGILAACPPADIDRLLPFLADGDASVLAEAENPQEALASLAYALASLSTPVFAPDGTQLPWRNVLLHRLVLTQHVGDMGDGWWSPSPDSPAADAVRSTRAAHATLLFLSAVP
jgi:hypothetical protein